MLSLLRVRQESTNMNECEGASFFSSEDFLPHLCRRFQLHVVFSGAELVISWDQACLVENVDH